MSVHRQQESPLWLAVCECSEEGGVEAHLNWVLPENATSQTSLQSENKDGVPKARLTYRFPLARHEGHNLTCVHHSGHGRKETKTLHIPRYCEFIRDDAQAPAQCSHSNCCSSHKRVGKHRDPRLLLNVQLLSLQTFPL